MFLCFCFFVLYFTCVLVWASGFSVAKNGITIVKEFNGRTTGEAYVQFTNKEDADKSLKKHKEKIGERWEFWFSLKGWDVGGNIFKYSTGLMVQNGFRRIVF